MQNKKSILVTGGAGYIGSHTIIELLKNENYRVISIDNFSNSSEITFNRIQQITNINVKNYAIDLNNKIEIENVLKLEKNIIGVIHFAAYKSVPESVSNPYKYYHNNITSLLNILECCLKFNIGNFIFSSSCSVYGNINKLPVSESTPFNKAESPYAYTKQIGEEIIKDYTKVYQLLNCISLRYFNPVGAHNSGLIGEDPINPPTNLVPIITQTAIGLRNKMQVFGNTYSTRDGSCIRDYIHVSDIAKAHVQALELLISKQNKTNNCTYNLGTGNGISVLEAIKAFEKVTSIKLNYEIAPPREGDVEAIFSNTELSQKELNWKATTSIEEMMLSAWKWQQHLKSTAN